MMGFVVVSTEASIPSEAMMHFPPIPTNSSDSGKHFANFTFSRNIFRFSSAKISYDLFLIIDYKFKIVPLFSLFYYFSLIFRENYYFPHTFTKSPSFPEIYVFLHTLCVFRFPLILP